ncbi:MAG TPA: site-2 protease family protein [Clostridiaceae bacterium]|nr:site-2 protease family protein [Clostridiaceae bacterium]
MNLLPFVLNYVFVAVVFLVSISFHEFSHAYISYKLGDPTAKNMGRLSLNPFKHIDAFGAIMMLIARIGWAKPVPINPMYYKDRKKGTLLVSLAGPLSNILLAFIFAFPLVYISSRYNLRNISVWNIKSILLTLSYMFIHLNLNLAVFNLIPVPPLDGSKIFGAILPARQYYKMLEYENYMVIGLMLIIFMFSKQFGAVLSMITQPLETTIITIASTIINIFI